MTLALRDSSPPDSPLARWDDRWKLAAMLLLITAVALTHSTVTLTIAVALSLSLAVMSRLTLSELLSRISLMLLAVLPFFVLPVFQDDGWMIATRIVARCFAIGLIVSALVHSTRLPRLLAAARSLGVPSALVLVAQIATRYLSILSAEVRRGRIAMRVRGFRLSTNARSYRTLGHLTGTVLVRSGERGERIADAMKCRGFDGHVNRLPATTSRWWDVVGFVLMALLAGGLVLGDRLAR